LTRLITYAIPGLPYGCVFALVAVGLVLTFKTSGVFNLAFGAQAYVSAAIYYALVKEHHVNQLVGFVLAVVIAAPLLGLILDRLLFRHIRTAPPVVKLVTALGLLVGIPSVVQFFFGTKQKFRPPGLWLNPDHVYHLGGYHIDGRGVTIVAATVISVVLLSIVFKYTALGLRMRAVVESPRLVELAGINADRVGGIAWMMSSFLAGLAGILLAPLATTVDPNNFTILLVAAIAAAAFGRLKNLPMTVLGGLVLGVGAELLTGYLPPASVWARGLRPSFPFLVLVALLLFLPGLRGAREATDPLTSCDPPPPALVSEDRDPRLDRLTKRLFPIFLVAFVLVSLFGLSSHWLLLVTQGLVFSVIMMSITMLTGLSGQISLCQMTFAGVGAFTAGQLAVHHNMAFLLAMVIGALVAAAVGALIALPALRLGGVYLALATLAFALMADNVIFPLDSVGGGQNGLIVPRPKLGPIDFGSDHAFFLLVLAIFTLCGFLVIFVRKGTTGQYLAAMRGSETAASTIGINPTRWKITVFALSAGIAGVGGALLASLQQATGPNDFNFLYSLVFMVLVLTTGARTVEGAANAGMGFIFIPEILSYFGGLKVLTYALFGYGTINYAKHPEGILEFQKRRSLDFIARQLDRREARKAARAAGAAREAAEPAGAAEPLTATPGGGGD
jgi:ABC-type branched-subunit amino acid transport system permease subunit